MRGGCNLICCGVQRVRLEDVNYKKRGSETDQWAEMIQVNECGLRESSG